VAFLVKRADQVVKLRRSEEREQGIEEMGIVKTYYCYVKL
jgi:hypothetical protein